MIIPIEISFHLIRWIIAKEGLNVFTEYAGSGGCRGRGNTGFTFRVSDRLQLDAAVYIGLTEEAPDFALSAGASFRF